MAHSDYIEDRIDNVEVNIKGFKQTWIAPEVEVLDSRNTYGGDPEFEAEIENCNTCDGKS